jgi:energy-coupling factor transporter ATP-binding protein EcfA2
VPPSQLAAPLRVGGGGAVRVRGLCQRYREVIALNGVDLDIRRGEIFALLGPNGAGKTTAVEILEGHRRRDAGQVAVLGTDWRPLPCAPAGAWPSPGPQASRGSFLTILSTRLRGPMMLIA